MSLNIRLAKATITTSNVAIFTNVTGQVTKIASITIQQPTTAGSKIVQIGIGTTGTPANVVLSYTIAAGQQKIVDFPNLVLSGTETLDVVSSAGTTEAVITVNGVKDLVA